MTRFSVVKVGEPANFGDGSHYTCPTEGMGGKRKTNEKNQEETSSQKNLRRLKEDPKWEENPKKEREKRVASPKKVENKYLSLNVI